MATQQPQARGNGEIVPRSKSQNEKKLAQMIVGMTDTLKKALPRHVTPDRMARIVLTALRITKNLSECSPVSFLGCVLSLAQLGLEPNTPLGHAYLIPRKIKGHYQCTQMIGYRGFIELARRSGMVTNIFAHAVWPDDVFEYSFGLHPDIIHKPGDKPHQGNGITHAYAVAKIRDAEPAFVVMTKAEIEARRKRSAASGDGPWVTDFVAMAQKTPVRELSKWIPQSAEMARAVLLDEAPELGKPQSSAFSDEVLDALKSEGLEAETSDVEVIDADTGEVLSGGREPGDDSAEE